MAVAGSRGRRHHHVVEAKVQEYWASRPVFILGA